MPSASILRNAGRQKNALRESENKFATVFRSNPVTLTLVSATDGRFVDVNDAFVANTGYSREEVIGRTSEELGIFADAREYEQLVSPAPGRPAGEGNGTAYPEEERRGPGLPVLFRYYSDAGQAAHPFDR